MLGLEGWWVMPCWGKRECIPRWRGKGWGRYDAGEGKWGYAALVPDWGLYVAGESHRRFRKTNGFQRMPACFKLLPKFSIRAIRCHPNIASEV